MTDRDALLEAIRRNPKEDAPRLMYADWIAEHRPDDPVTAPTVEFIALSCQGKNSPMMPKVAYQWLDANWRRLVPALLDRLHSPPRIGTQVPVPGHDSLVVTAENQGLAWTRTGRNVWCRLHTRGKLDRERPEWTHLCSVRMVFWKGFCVSFGSWASWAKPSIRSAIQSQQPLAVEVGV